MTLDWEPCHLVPIWLMILPLEHCHSGGVLVVAKLKKDRLNLTLMTLLGTLSFSSNMVNDFSFGALSHWRQACGSQIKKDRLNLTLITLLGTLSFGSNMVNVFFLWSIVTLATGLW